MLNKILQSRQPSVSLKIVELETKTLLKKKSEETVCTPLHGKSGLGSNV